MAVKAAGRIAAKLAAGSKMAVRMAVKMVEGGCEDGCEDGCELGCELTYLAAKELVCEMAASLERRRRCNPCRCREQHETHE
jgi:hypothetical protein